MAIRYENEDILSDWELLKNGIEIDGISKSSSSLSDSHAAVQQQLKGYADLTYAETVKLYPKRDLARVRPECHILSDEIQTSLDNKRYVFTLRSYKRGLWPRRN